MSTTRKEEDTGRLARFVSNLLEMTRVQSGTLDLERDWIDVADLLTNAVQRARKVFAGRPIVQYCPPDLPLIQGNAVMLEQVLYNLLDNADKYAPPGTSTAVRARTDGEAAVISVEDQGIGILPDALVRVFEKFTRLNPGDGRPAGTGFGLAIAKGVVEATGGSIRAESPAAEGMGSRFIIRLPAVAARHDKVIAFAEEERPRVGVPAHSGGG